eukprot:3190966-Alexandrium_andersonii.AAC.1
MDATSSTPPSRGTHGLPRAEASRAQSCWRVRRGHLLGLCGQVADCLFAGAGRAQPTQRAMPQSRPPEREGLE